MERATGIEPAQSVWKTETLPLSYARAPRRSAIVPSQITGFRSLASRTAGGPYTWRVSARGVAQLGSALALGARGRGFESRHPDRQATPAPPAEPHHVRARHVRRSTTHCEEHRREPEPDPRPARRRGAFRRARSQPRGGVQEDRLADPHPGLPPGQGAGPDHRPARRARRGARGGHQRGAAARLHRGRPRARAAPARAARDRRHQPRRRRARCSFTAEVDVRPEITLPDLDGSRSPSTTSRSATPTSTSSSTRCAIGSARLTGVERPVADRRLRLARPARDGRRRGGRGGQREGPVLRGRHRTT